MATVLLYHRRREHMKGRLLQVGTGEGKSIIVYLIASIEVLLNGKKVDIVTSQLLIAKDGFEDQHDLYQALKIEAGYLDPKHQFNFYHQK